MLKLLEERAIALEDVNFKKAEEIEDKLTAVKNENFREIMVPNTFFATFNHEIAFHKAIEANNFYYKDEHLNLERAPEPSNIIWENRDSHIRTNLRFLVVLLIMFLVAGLFFVGAVFGIQTQLMYIYLRSPPGVECKHVLEIHGDEIANLAA